MIYVMKLRQLSDNCHELVLAKGTILFSYDTPVAVSYDLPVGDKHGVFKTSEKFSKTTSKHINAWTATKREIPQHEIYAASSEILRS